VNSTFTERLLCGTLGRDSLGGILPLPKGFFIGLSGGIHLDEFYVHREASLSDSRLGFTLVNSIFAERFLYRTLDWDSLGCILPLSRGFFIEI